MKRFGLFAAALLLSLGVSSTVFADYNSNFHLAARFGVGYAQNDDMNNYVSGFGDSVADQVNAIASANGLVGGFEGNDKKANVNYGFDIEPRFFFGDFGFSFSIGYHSTESESTVESSRWSDTASRKMELSVIPMLATLYYRSKINDDLFFLLGAGAGYYKAALEYSWEDNISISSTYGQSNSQEATGSTIGYHARIELDYMFSSVAIYGGIAGRYVNIDNFEYQGITVKNSDGSNLEAGLTGVFMYFGASLML